MNVVHVSTHDVGGAAVAAHRLHRGLLEGGIHSKFLVLFNAGTFSDVETFSPVKGSFLFKKIVNRISRKAPSGVRDFLAENKNVEMFSSPDTLYDATTNDLLRHADIVHLHWIANFVDYSTFFKKIRKPVVWSFHDENPFLGGCHYSNDALSLPAALKNTEMTFIKRKISAIQPLNRLDIVCPSDWMREKASESFYGKFRITTIPYGLDEREFKLIDRREARRELNLKEDDLIFCVVAADLKTYRKGFDVILSLMDFICAKERTKVLLVGNPPEVALPENAIRMGKLDNPRTLNLVYAASDALLFPSRQDNLPNVLIESLYSGTPVLGFAVGGVPEIVQTGADGILADEVSVSSFKRLIEEFVAKQGTFSKIEIRGRAIQNFSSKKQADCMMSLYKEILNAKPVFEVV